MAKKGLILDSNKQSFMPITRGELVLDASGNPAFHSTQFVATESQPGLMSEEDKKLLNTINTETETVKVLTNTSNGIKWEEIPNEINYNPTEINLSTDWTPSGLILSGDKFQTGLYLIKIMSGNLLFSGITSVYVGETVEDEIVLHMGGIADESQGRIYAKIALNETADFGEIYLSTNKPQSAITNLSITMKKMI